MKKNIIIWDIDETLTTWREVKHIKVIDAFNRAEAGEDPTTAWAEWNLELENDEPLTSMVELCKEVKAMGAINIMVTSRGEANRERTMQWMINHGIPCDALYMRPLEMEAMGSPEYKDTIISTHIGWNNVSMVIDDHKGVLAMAMGNGATAILPPTTR